MHSNPQHDVVDQGGGLPGPAPALPIPSMCEERPFLGLADELIARSRRAFTVGDRGAEHATKHNPWGWA